jgi:phosphopantothenoylcysteine decarboxylase/phosphopantothenate--cysteine ligase
VFADLWDERVDNGMAHIDLSRGADAILVAPASADFMAKLAQGRADDLLATLVPGARLPAAGGAGDEPADVGTPGDTQRNVAQIGLPTACAILGPDTRASRPAARLGFGRMLEPEQLVDDLEAYFQPKSAGRRASVLMTAGPTYEAIDAVRGITNRSSGKMGYALARAAIEAGAEVTLVTGPTSLAPPEAMREIDVGGQRAADARSGGKTHRRRPISSLPWPPSPIITCSTRRTTRSRKMRTSSPWNWRPTRISSPMSRRMAPPFCVGFAAESENMEEYAELKRKRKHLPLIVANDARAAIGSDEAELILLDDDGRHVLARADKHTQARRLIEHIARLYNATSALKPYSDN